MNTTAWFPPLFSTLDAITAMLCSAAVIGLMKLIFVALKVPCSACIHAYHSHHYVCVCVCAERFASGCSMIHSFFLVRLTSGHILRFSRCYFCVVLCSYSYRPRYTVSTTQTHDWLAASCPQASCKLSPG